ncbi:MAG: tRNA (adenosine(37)-N6)-threonylcarbamoyltransferase complex ATPase subunit type 1 TsaE [bacterium]|nr:tRNA (adenosine(37)-N6)-threonylcarbamoyltransferase complex ATPase subunit type 1 TsaE [bacterium]
MALKYITKSILQTKSVGRDLVKKITKNKSQKKAAVLGLTGNLGGGKTTFVQGFAKGLGITEKILSPTFVIMRKFKIPLSNAGKPNSYFKTFYHIDCYRIKHPKEILDLGFKKILADPESIIAIEWAENVKKLLPKNTLWLHFDFIDKGARKITMTEDARKN